MIVALGHPNRLPILIALEAEPRTISELVDATGIGREPVKHAIKILAAAGLVEVKESIQDKNLVRHVYSTPGRGWRTILDALTTVSESIADSRARR
jgi:DNA-binding transcriptional ArsR family regulator